MLTRHCSLTHMNAANQREFLIAALAEIRRVPRSWALLALRDLPPGELLTVEDAVRWLVCAGLLLRYGGERAARDAQTIQTAGCGNRQARRRNGALRA